MKTFCVKDSEYLAITEKIHPADYAGEFHTQNFFELTLVIGGTGTYEVQRGRTTRAIPVTPDTMLLCGGRVRHRCVDMPGAPLQQLMVCFGYRYLAPFSLLPRILKLLKTGDPLLLNGIRVALRLKPLFRRLLTEYSQAQPGHDDTVKALLILLLTEICRLVTDTPQKSGQPMDTRIREAVELIERQYDQHFSLPDCAKRCGLSARHFSELFKKHTGKTFVQFVNAYRVSVACDRLRDTDKKIITIAFETGFENLSLFNRTFKRICHMTPQQYRVSHSPTANHE